MAATLTPLSPDPENGSAGRRTSMRVLRLAGGRRPEPAPAPPPREARPITVAQAVAGGLLLLTGLLVAFAAYLVVGSTLAANRAQDVLYRDLRTDLAAATVPVSGPVAPGTPLGLVTIPEIGLNQVFVEGSSSDQTKFGPGLETDSVLPGQTGHSVLIGHRSTSGAAFAHLDQLQPGDRIAVATGQGRFTYVVDLVRTSDAPPTQVRVVPSRLTLVTSDPAFTPDRKAMVSARLVGKALPASTGTTAPPSDQPGHGTASHLVGLLLWSQLLLLVTLLVTWTAMRTTQRRWLWIGATPVLLAILWMVFENLALLLPNTL